MLGWRRLQTVTFSAVVDAHATTSAADSPAPMSNRAGRRGHGRYLTTTNMFVVFSDFPPPDRAVRY